MNVPGAGHLQLTVLDVKKWNQRIKDGEASIEVCPAEVIDDLLSERNRSAIRKDSKLGPPPGLGPSIVQYFGAGAGPASEAASRSSPPERDGDDDRNLTRYLKWLADKYPEQREEFISHSVQLSHCGWGFLTCARSQIMTGKR